MHKILDYQNRPAKERKVGQKVTLSIAYLCYFCGLISAAISVKVGMESTTTPTFASFLAITVFFACVGIVLQVLGSGNLPSLKVEDHPEQQPIQQAELHAELHAELQTAEKAQ